MTKQHDWPTPFLAQLSPNNKHHKRLLRKIIDDGMSWWPRATRTTLKKVKNLESLKDAEASLWGILCHAYVMAVSFEKTSGGHKSKLAESLLSEIERHEKIACSLKDLFELTGDPEYKKRLRKTYFILSRLYHEIGSSRNQAQKPVSSADFFAMQIKQRIGYSNNLIADITESILGKRVRLDRKLNRDLLKGLQYNALFFNDKDLAKAAKWAIEHPQEFRKMFFAAKKYRHSH